MNLGLDREATAVNRSVDGDPGPSAGLRCFQVRKRIRLDVPNKSAHLHFRFHMTFIQVHQ